jgi:hypothetical protein
MSDWGRETTITLTEFLWIKQIIIVLIYLCNCGIVVQFWKEFAGWAQPGNPLVQYDFNGVANLSPR